MDPAEAQRVYYKRTASEYDAVHVSPSDEHALGLGLVATHIERLGATSLLDTGCGTGRAMRYFRERFPDMTVRGNDPSPELYAASQLPDELFDCVSSDKLPYNDGQFDVVVEFGVLHHVANPERIVGEMLRVARRAIFLSDVNIYGSGRFGLLKYLLMRARLLRTINRLRRGGRDWYYSEGDGVAYSYSVFDSYRQVERACAAVHVLPLDGSGPARFGSVHVLLCGFKDPI